MVFYGALTLNYDVCKNPNPYCENPLLNKNALAKSICNFYNKVCSRGIAPLTCLHKNGCSLGTMTETCKQRCGCDDPLCSNQSPVPTACLSQYGCSLPNITSQCKKKCKCGSEPDCRKAAFLGICGYVTKAPRWWEVIVNYTLPIFKDIAGGILTVMGGAAVAELWSWDSVPITIEGYRNIGSCYPVPVAPLPPPYGVTSKPLFEQSPIVQKVCTDNPEHFSSPPPEQKLCVAPLAAPALSKNSSFDRTCVRITFNNATRIYNPSPPSNPDFYNDGTGTYPALYTNQPLTGACSSKSSCYFSANDTTSLVTHFNGDPKLAFVGYNKANVYEMCYGFAPNSVGSSSENLTIEDIYGNTKTVTLIRGCKQPHSSRSCSDTGNQTYLTETQVCVQDVNTQDIYGCVDRPGAKLSISMCNNKANTATNGCMNLNVLDPVTNQTKFSCSVNYSSPTSTTPPTITNSCPKFALNSHSTQETEIAPVEFTDKCYNIPFNRTVRGQGTFGVFAEYRPDTVGCDAATKPSFNCNTGLVSPIPKTAGVYYTREGKYQYGASKLCLNSRLLSPLAHDMSLPTCIKNCNSVCIPSLSFQPSDGTVQNPAICMRTTPSPSVQSPLTSTQTCAPNPKSLISPTVSSRKKYPIEDGLCVDTMLFDFQDCKKIKKTAFKTQCKNFTACCSTTCDDLLLKCKQNKSSPKCYNNQTGNACTDLGSLCVRSNKNTNCSTYLNDCTTSCNCTNFVNYCMKQNAFAYMDQCTNTYSNCLNNKLPSTGADNNCYYIQPTKQYTPPKVPDFCPTNWNPAEVCKGLGTNYDNGFSKLYNIQNKTLTPASSFLANAVKCTGKDTNNSEIVCCNGKVYSNGNCPTAEQVSKCPANWNADDICKNIIYSGKKTTGFGGQFFLSNGPRLTKLPSNIGANAFFCNAEQGGLVVACCDGTDWWNTWTCPLPN